MKLRIKGNSIRYRLNKTEVTTLAVTGYLEEQTFFASGKFVYALQKVDEGNELSASFANNKITMFIPGALIRNWPEDSIVGFEANMPVSENKFLYLLIEKDFVCLDHTTEDQRDNYSNPNKAC
jgi:hypothetical protein